MHFIKEIKSHHLRQRRRRQRRATMNSANSNSSFHNNHHNQEMIICETLRYIAPNYAPQTAIRFGTSPSGTMQATEGNAPGLLRIEYRIRAALQRYVAVRMKVALGYPCQVETWISITNI